jgi:hypothetical protein
MCLISIITSYKFLQLCDSSSWELDITVFIRCESNQSRQYNCLRSFWVSTAVLRTDQSCLTKLCYRDAIKITSTSGWRNCLLEHIQPLDLTSCLSMPVIYFCYVLLVLNYPYKAEVIRYRICHTTKLAVISKQLWTFKSVSFLSSFTNPCLIFSFTLYTTWSSSGV